MDKEYFNLNNISSLLWKGDNDKVFIAIHGSMSNKEDRVIEVFAKEALKYGYDTISFDLKGHGSRKEEGEAKEVIDYTKDLAEIFSFIKDKYDNINVFGCSMGAYFSLLEYKDKDINKSLFLSPVVDMLELIKDMMNYYNISEEELEQKKEILLPSGMKLYFDYYNYVKKNPIIKVNSKVDILYSFNDDNVSLASVKNFIDKFDAKLKITQKAGHYFHTDEDMKIFTQWVDSVLCSEE